MKQNFFICNHCGNIVAFVRNSGIPVVCCGEDMHELIPCTADASVEKHVTVFTVTDGTVSVEVGSVLHPMSAEHHIEWISLQTKYGNQRKELCPTGEPCVTFAVTQGDSVEAVYAYCNLHGLWEAKGL